MAERMLAKKFLRGLGLKDVPKTEGECVQVLIRAYESMQHLDPNRSALQPRGRGRFGRLLWRLFGAWL